MSTRPNLSLTSANSLAHWSRSTTSSSYAQPLPPSASIMSMVAWARSRCRAAATTVAPCLASPMQVARPLPRPSPGDCPPPTTTAIRPVKSCSMMCLLLRTYAAPRPHETTISLQCSGSYLALSRCVRPAIDGSDVAPCQYEAPIDSVISSVRLWLSERGGVGWFLGSTRPGKKNRPHCPANHPKTPRSVRPPLGFMQWPGITDPPWPLSVVASEGASLWAMAYWNLENIWAILPRKHGNCMLMEHTLDPRGDEMYESSSPRAVTRKE